MNGAGRRASTRLDAIAHNRALDTRGASMGKGDKRSFKGKVFKGSYGKTRPRHQKKKTAGTTQRKK